MKFVTVIGKFTGTVIVTPARKVYYLASDCKYHGYGFALLCKTHTGRYTFENFLALSKSEYKKLVKM